MRNARFLAKLYSLVNDMNVSSGIRSRNLEHLFYTEHTYDVSSTFAFSNFLNL